MAKLYFNYSSMNAGKSTVLLQAAYNYEERGMNTLLLIAAFDDRGGKGRIASRIGLGADADVFNSADNVFDHILRADEAKKVDAVFVDEAQFLTEDQVWQLARVADTLRIPVMCFGLRTDFQGKLFPGSAALLALADNLKEIKTICWCGRKATMVARLDADGKIVEEGDQVVIGGNDKYVSLCRRHWSERKLG
ncbi:MULTISPECIES: thymidine kinase [Stappiaceae]|jgi:thymidine kinase|uniref:Thymidine kinase n=2 Tax=Roseibium TaxID=150830 RepID=A0A0M6Y1R2_9HYPH|nr:MULTISPECIES: thymidine kinase [Stappiaceae]MEC9418110.1 thymidine kinase [Pseudomonadota bacterium]AMN52311.1 thymidine kinase [Labrenzia sp. CP4]AQQ05508.1 thymidine kinase [Roseibium aggregatum]ERP98386.1 thymidine kinase [Labrenzia sp. C1B10]ERP99891.1 thymidine kinase [Labrenzia sp. C1B70]